MDPTGEQEMWSTLCERRRPERRKKIEAALKFSRTPRTASRLFLLRISGAGFIPA